MRHGNRKQPEREIHQPISSDEKRATRNYMRSKTAMRLTRPFHFRPCPLRHPSENIDRRSPIPSLAINHKFLRNYQSLKPCGQSPFHHATKVPLRLPRCPNSTSPVSWRGLDLRYSFGNLGVSPSQMKVALSVLMIAFESTSVFGCDAE